MPTRPTTPEQKADAARLDRLFSQWLSALEEAGKRQTQEDIAASLDCSQSALSQRLKGKLAINPKFAVRIAQLIGVSVRDFSPDLADQIDQLSSGSRTEHPQVARLHTGEERQKWRASQTSVSDAVDTLSDALEQASSDLRDALAANLAGWARAGGIEPWRGLVKGLLAGRAATPAPAPRVGNGH